MNTSRLKFNKIDYILIIVVVAIIFGSFLFNIFYFKKDKTNNLEIEIYISGEKKYVYPLEEDRTIILKKSDYDVLLDDMEIEISNSQVRVKKEVSPNLYCSRQGFVSKSGQIIACLPNDVFILIKGSSQYDWVMPS